jgi:NitT/TauT family transport system ATP-binding protein
LFVTHSVAEAVYLSSRVLVMSRRPGAILGEVAVPAPYPRRPEQRFAPEFTELAARVSAILRADRTGEAVASGAFRKTAEPVEAAEVVEEPTPGAEVST